MNILIAILALSFIIIIHELGHFIAARAVGIKVIEFALFMGPKLFSFKRKGTIYSIRAIPIGGFVSMEGEEKEVDSDTSYSGMPAYKKIIAVAAGPVANFAFALLLLFILFLTSGYALDTNTVVDSRKPAYEAGMRDGDRLISIDGRRVYDPLDMTVLLYNSDGQPVDIVYESDGTRHEATLIPEDMGGIKYKVNFFPRDDSSTVLEIDSDMEKDAYEESMRAMNDSDDTIGYDDLDNIDLSGVF